MSSERPPFDPTKKFSEQFDVDFALQAAELGIWAVDPTTNKVIWDDRCRSFFGLSQGNQLPYEQAIQYIHAEDRDRVNQAVETALNSRLGGLYDQTYRTIGADDGQLRWVRFTGQAYFTPAGKLARFGGIAQEVTQQVLAQQQIADDAALFSTLANSIGQLAWIANAQGWIYWYNDRWYEYTGTTLEQMQGWGWRAVHHPDYVDNVTNEIQLAWQASQPFEMTFPLRAKNGQYRQFLTRINPICDPSGQVIQWVGTNTDIEEQKQQEAQLEDLIQQRTRELTLANQDLKRSNDNLQQFAYIASHDLQEPLRKIQSFGDLLKARFADQLGDGTDYLNRMQAAASRMSTLIRDLLAYSRISSQRNGNDLVSLDEVVDKVLNDLELIIEETGATIEVGVLPSLPGDVSQLGQLFQNLIANALKFRRPSTAPVIQISANVVGTDQLPPPVEPSRRVAVYHCIEVIDNGIGFDEKYLDRIFQVFQRLHSRSEITGTGIGLAICEKVVTSHGGAITATSQIGQGTTFSVYLPV